STPAVRPCARSSAAFAAGGAGGAARTLAAGRRAGGEDSGGAGGSTGASGRVRPGSGRAWAATARHSFSSSALSRLFPIEQQDMQLARPVRAHLDLLLDVAAARRAGDEIDRARHAAAAIAAAEP